MRWAKVRIAMPPISKAIAAWPAVLGKARAMLAQSQTNSEATRGAPQNQLAALSAGA